MLTLSSIRLALVIGDSATASVSIAQLFHNRGLFAGSQFRSQRSVTPAAPLVLSVQRLLAALGFAYMLLLVE